MESKYPPWFCYVNSLLLYSYTTKADLFSLGKTIKYFQDKLRTDVTTKDQQLVDWVIEACINESPHLRCSASKLLKKIK
jgi:hypothetical protein